MKNEKKTLSTGVLRKEPGTVSAVVNLANVSDKDQEITVEVWNWSSYLDGTSTRFLHDFIC
ncbi:MAG: hypothetical protein ACQET6_07355 [Bacillota bacterium]|uniref:hypothetical protein n=1 Tax=Rossellomorea sp. FM04394 TaxID=3243076 RepID=UPI0035A58A92